MNPAGTELVVSHYGAHSRRQHTEKPNDSDRPSNESPNVKASRIPVNRLLIADIQVRHSDLPPADYKIVRDTRKGQLASAATSEQRLNTHRSPEAGTVRRLSITKNFVNEDARSANLQGLTANATAATSKVPLRVFRYRGKIDDRL